MAVDSQGPSFLRHVQRRVYRKLSMSGSAGSSWPFQDDAAELGGVSRAYGRICRFLVTFESSSSARQSDPIT